IVDSQFQYMCEHPRSDEKLSDCLTKFFKIKAIECPDIPKGQPVDKPIIKNGHNWYMEIMSDRNKDNPVSSTYKKPNSAVPPVPAIVWDINSNEDKNVYYTHEGKPICVYNHSYSEDYPYAVILKIVDSQFQYMCEHPRSDESPSDCLTKFFKIKS
ncbi:MAG TPA: hypothetical protein VKR58_00385, partial [Aquella sp.]|nr:hypothetical protein [Aquella sp.]